eukprot:TRINITY_DN24806_c0_g3_i2.p1 TRINITY_DN24806_c0_g3~~TRINITY_DN24806_c0_g3_i2.p1  ORF type:complete len:244 (-),score=42.39 TRINITY_DN24806_c0_g3_i2:503-1234(-)
MAIARRDLSIIKVLIDHGCWSPLFNEEIALERSGRDEEALKLYQEHLSFLDETMESDLADAVPTWQVFLLALAGKYRVKARLALESNDFELFFRSVDKAWLLHVRGHTNNCEHLFWIKGITLRKSENLDGASEVFKSLASTASRLYASFGLYELGLHREAASLLTDVFVNPRMSNRLLYLAQLCRCLISLRDVSEKARRLYVRLELNACDVHLCKSQGLSPLEVRFVEQVRHRLRSFKTVMTL